MIKSFPIMVSILLGLFPNIQGAVEAMTHGHQNECVVLLHGLGRSPASMSRLEEYLSGQGYRTVNFGYPSRSDSVERIAEVYIPNALAQCRPRDVTKVHFVTHSLGGIIVRQYLQTNSLPDGSRLVMLAPPNHGSEAVEFFKKVFLYRWITGPAGQQMGTSSKSISNRLKPIGIEVGIIAGDRSLNPIFSALIPGPDDGRVSVESAKLDEMVDFLVIPSSHSFIMRKQAVMKQVVHFLEHGKFDHTQGHGAARF